MGTINMKIFESSIYYATPNELAYERKILRRITFSDQKNNNRRISRSLFKLSKIIKRQLRGISKDINSHVSKTR